jgi:isocitrate/isopropylmalate dehydrogenase
MLDHLRAPRGAEAVRKAVARVLAAGTPRTPDLGGSAGTVEVGRAVLQALEVISP